MLTNSNEYRELKLRISEFLNIDPSFIYSICNPLKNKKKLVWLVIFTNSNRSTMLRDKNNLLTKIE